MEHVAIDLGRPNSVKCELGANGKKVILRFRLFEVSLGKGLNHSHSERPDILLAPSQHSTFDTKPGLGPFNGLLE